MNWYSTKYSTINLNCVRCFSVVSEHYSGAKEPYRLRAFFDQNDYEDIGSYSTIEEAEAAKSELDYKLRLNCGGVLQ